MEVYEFEKSLQTRLQETSDVLCVRGVSIPASAVRNEWANYIEIAIEPTGWQAVWRIPRVICEELSIRYPTVVVGTVEQVLFDELKAIFLVESVQDDDVHMPEKQVVSLEELWPLKEQENDALNVDRTADCVDQLRFFYQHVWMPWDNDEDDDRVDWADRHLYDRIKFYYEIKKKSMSKRLLSHVLALLAEAKYIQKKRELLELEIENGDDAAENGLDEDEDIEHKKANDLVELHLRLNTIKNEIEILENPDLRDAYERVRFAEESEYNQSSRQSEPSSVEAFVVSQIGTVDEHIEYLNEARKMIDPQKVLRLCDSLQKALDGCAPSNDIYLPPGKHVIKFLEYLNGEGSLRAVSSAVRFVEAYAKGKLDAIEGKAVITSKDDDSILLTVNGDYLFENVMLDCTNVRTGVLIKKGNVTFKNCCFIGDAKSSTKQGIVAFGNSTLVFEHCIIKGFSTGIYTNQNCSIQLVNSTVADCINGIDILFGGDASFHSSKIEKCKNYGLLLEVDDPLDVSQESRHTYDDYAQVKRDELTFEGACEFSNNGKANFVISTIGNDKFNSSCFVDQSSGEQSSSNVSRFSLYGSDARSGSNCSGQDDDNDGDDDNDDGLDIENIDFKGLLSIKQGEYGGSFSFISSGDDFDEMLESQYVTADSGSEVAEDSFTEDGTVKCEEDSHDSIGLTEDSIAVIEIDDTVIEID